MYLLTDQIVVFSCWYIPTDEVIITGIWLNAVAKPIIYQPTTKQRMLRKPLFKIEEIDFEQRFQRLFVTYDLFSRQVKVIFHVVRR